MKKLALSIIVLSSVFANSVLTVNAKSGILEETLNLDVWVEIYQMNNINIGNYTFYSKNLQNTYNNLLAIDKIFKTEIIEKYRKWELKYYELSWAIDNYASFIYYTNKMLSEIELLDLWIDSSRQLLDSIEKNYTYVRSYYNKIDALLELNRNIRGY